jgi:MFS family permease
MSALFALKDSIASRGFNRWLVPPAAIAIHLCLGQAYALSVFYGPLAALAGPDQRGGVAWSAGHLDGVFALAMVMLGLTAAVSGRLASIGPRSAMFLSALCFCAGLAIAGVGIHVHQIVLLYLGYGVFGGIGLGLGYVAPLQMLVDWFPDRMGFATGLAITGFGGGAMLATGLSTILLDLFKSAASPGVGETFLVLGGIYLVFMCAAALAVRLPPKGGASAAPVPSIDARQAMKLPQFYLLWFLLFLNVATGINLLANAPRVLDEAMLPAATPAAIGGFVALLSLSNMVGRLLFSLASDHLGRKNTATLLLLMGTILYASGPQLAARLNVAFSVLGYMLMIAVYGGLFAIMPAYVADIFGPRFMSSIHGRILTAWSVGAVASFALAHAAQDGARDAITYGTALLLLLALGLNLLIRPAVEPLPRPDEASPEAAAVPMPAFSVPAILRMVGAWAAVTVPLLGGVAFTIYQAAALPLAWEIAVTLLPLALGCGVCAVFYHLDRSRFAVRGVAGPYFAALALLFGLYASLMATEVWQKIARANTLLNTEVSALQSVTWISEVVAPGDRRVRSAVGDYVEELAKTDRLVLPDNRVPAARQLLYRLYAIGADQSLFNGHALQNTSFMSAVESLRAANLERNQLKSEPHDPMKILSLLLFGLLTQIAIAFCHAGNQRAISTTVMLFSMGFMASVAILELLDNSFRYADAASVVSHLEIR